MISPYIWTDFLVIVILEGKKWKNLSSYYRLCYSVSSYYDITWSIWKIKENLSQTLN